MLLFCANNQQELQKPQAQPDLYSIYPAPIPQKVIGTQGEYFIVGSLKQNEDPVHLKRILDLLNNEL